MTQRSTSLLVAGVPLERGHPKHIERKGDIGITEFDRRTGKVTAIHTPPHPLVRIHELMHARHTVRRRYERQFAGVNGLVANICEDVRLHMRHWPWRHSYTPTSIKKAVYDYIANEREAMERDLTEHPEKRGTWPDFATRFRAQAVIFGLKGLSDDEDFATDAQERLCNMALYLCRNNREGEAAKMLQVAFFPPLENMPPLPPGKYPNKSKPIKTKSGQKAEMEIIELPHSEHIAEATVGTRLATSGSRLYRPALRRPILPQRMFVRRAAVEAGGTILVDASGSMGDFNEITDWCKKAPFGTIAYYAGTDEASNAKGWLYVFARNGKRAIEPIEPEIRGNTVDGPALDWLMQQAPPRIMVTDRQFCGAYDSAAQMVRLEQLERDGEIKVVNYNNSDD